MKAKGIAKVGWRNLVLAALDQPRDCFDGFSDRFGYSYSNTFGHKIGNEFANDGVIRDIGNDVPLVIPPTRHLMQNRVC